LNFKVKIGEHSSKEYCSWEEVEFLIKLLADRIQKSNKKYLVIDEICDTGNTFSKVADELKIVHCDFAFLISRYKHNSGALVGKILDLLRN
jgi:hypoxanthine phosphoribosyltransferase